MARVSLRARFGASSGEQAGRARLVAVLAVCAVVAALTSSVANYARIGLRCEDGRLVAFRGLPLPAGQADLDAEQYPPLVAPPGACRPERFASIAQLDERYLAQTLERVDAAVASDDPVTLEQAAAALDRLGADVFAARRGALLIAMGRADLRTADAALQRVRSRITAARDAGADPDELAELERALRGLLLPALPLPAPPPASDDETPPEPPKGRHL